MDVGIDQVLGKYAHEFDCKTAWRQHFSIERDQDNIWRFNVRRFFCTASSNVRCGLSTFFLYFLFCSFYNWLRYVTSSFNEP